MKINASWGKITVDSNQDQNLIITYWNRDQKCKFKSS